jgi:hypothetical protein
MDFLGDIGGIIDILVSFFGIFLFTFSERSFYISAIESMNEDKIQQTFTACEKFRLIFFP